MIFHFKKRTFPFHHVVDSISFPLHLFSCIRDRVISEILLKMSEHSTGNINNGTLNIKHEVKLLIKIVTLLGSDNNRQ